MSCARRIGVLLGAVIVLASFVLASPFNSAHAQNQAGKMSKESVLPSKVQYDQNISDSLENNEWDLGPYTLTNLSYTLGAGGTLLLGSTDSSGNTTGGAVPQLGQAIANMISHPPASGEEYIADLLHNSPFLGTPAYAQGVGFQSLSPILPLWKGFRDLAYILFIFVFVGLGFMIMFRQKLSGQTVVTISSALPDMVVTLILITFSYAIAGFVVDIMYLLIYLMAGIFASITDNGITFQQFVEIGLQKNIFSNGLGLVFTENTSGQLGGEFTTSVAGNAAMALADLVSGFFGSNSDLVDFVGSAFGVATGVVGFLILAIAIFYAVVKTFFKLLMSYVGFIIMVIFSPFQLLLAVFQGRGEFVQWFKNLLGYLIPFPVVIGMIFLAIVISGQGDFEGLGGGETGNVGFQPPQLALPVVGNEGAGGAIGAIQGLIVIGILMLIPEGVKYGQKWVGAKNPFEGFLTDINANLQKGWKGGQVVDGFGPNLPGMSKLSPKLVGGAALGTAGAIGGAATGGYLGYKTMRDKGYDAAAVLAGAGGAALGGVSGAAVGTGVGVIGVTRTQNIIKNVGEKGKAVTNISRAVDRGVQEPLKLREAKANVQRTTSGTPETNQQAPEEPSATA